MRKVREARAQFVREAGRCWICKIRVALCCHEMSRGCHREPSLSERCTWLPTCNQCNCDSLDDYSEWPLERQLAIKWVYDRGYFDLLRFNEIRGRAPTAITMADVIPHICRELDR